MKPYHGTDPKRKQKFVGCCEWTWSSKLFGHHQSNLFTSPSFSCSASVTATAGTTPCWRAAVEIQATPKRSGKSEEKEGKKGEGRGNKKVLLLMSFQDGCEPKTKKLLCEIPADVGPASRGEGWWKCWGWEVCVYRYVTWFFLQTRLHSWRQEWRGQRRLRVPFAFQL